MGIVLSLLLSARAIALATKPPEKPVCRAQIHGRFWPGAANANGRAAQELAQCGALEMCTSRGRRYSWQPVTVNFRQLGKAPQEPTPACAALMQKYGASR